MIEDLKFSFLESKPRPGLALSLLHPLSNLLPLPYIHPLTGYFVDVQYKFLCFKPHPSHHPPFGYGGASPTASAPCFAFTPRRAQPASLDACWEARLTGHDRLRSSPSSESHPHRRRARAIRTNLLFTQLPTASYAPPYTGQSEIC
jgi:hypothetical protein